MTYDWMNKLWSVHTMECYSPIKRNEVVTDMQHG